MWASRTAQISAFVLVIALYVAARIWGLTASCLWFDEIFSVHAAEHSWNSILSFVALDLIHPPLFYVLLKLWIAIGGDSILWLRSLPVAISVLAVFPFIALCRELRLSLWTQILALFLFAVNGSLIKYAQEVRMYSLLLCLSLFSMWLFARYFIRGKSFVPLVIVNVLLIYSHYFGWLFVLAEVSAIIAFQWIKWRHAVTMLGVSIVSFLPWIVAVVLASRSGSGLSQNIGWMSRPGILAVGTFLANLVEPFHFQASSAGLVSVYTISIPLLLIALSGIAIYATRALKADAKEQRTLGLLLLFILTPIVIAFTASWIMPHSIWGTRHLIIVFAPVSIFLAVVFSSRPPSWFPPAAAALIVVFAGYGFAMRFVRDTPRYSWCEWEPLTETARDRQGTSIYTVEDLVAYHIWFSGRTFPGSRVVKVNGIDGVREDRAYFLPRGFGGVETIDLADVSNKSVWLAFRGPPVVETETPLRNFLVKGYRITDRADTAVGGEDLVMVLLEKSDQ